MTEKLRGHADGAECEGDFALCSLLVEASDRIEELEAEVEEAQALPSPSGDDILQLRADESSYGVVELERMAVRLFSANTEASGMGEDALKWIDLEESAREFWRKIARAAIAALPPSGALGLARELEDLLADPETIQAAKAGMVARALVAMLGGEK